MQWTWGNHIYHWVGNHIYHWVTIWLDTLSYQHISDRSVCQRCSHRSPTWQGEVRLLSSSRKGGQKAMLLCRFGWFPYCLYMYISYVCMYIYIYTCMYMFMYMYIYVHVIICLCICICICIYKCMYIISHTKQTWHERVHRRFPDWYSN